MHRYHPDPDRDDDPDALVWDDCPDCERNARHPLAYFDQDRLWALWRLVQQVELGAEGRSFYRNGTEGLAGGKFYRVYAAVSNNPTLFAEMMRYANPIEECIECGSGRRAMVLLPNDRRVCARCAAAEVAS